MLIGITTIAYNQPEALLRMVESATKSTEREIQFHLLRHSKMKGVVGACEYIRDNYNCVYYPLGYNAGVARSWNEGLLGSIQRGCTATFLVNDDIEFNKGDLDAMLELEQKHPQAWGVLCSGVNVGNNTWVDDHGLACVLITRHGLQTVGMFDENFFPAYNEDIDWTYRAQLAGLKSVSAKTNVQHIGSAAIKASPVLRQQNHTTHGKNDEYWEQKWGAKKPHTSHKIPFGEDRYHPYYIDPKNRHAPYPGRDRTDHSIVRI